MLSMSHAVVKAGEMEKENDWFIIEGDAGIGRLNGRRSRVFPSDLTPYSVPEFFTFVGVGGSCMP